MVHATEIDTTLEQLADKWNCHPKTIEAWAKSCADLYSVVIHHRGPFNPAQVAMIDDFGKHVSKRAHEFFPETGQTMRLSKFEYERLIRNRATTPQPTAEHGRYEPDEYEVADQAGDVLGTIARRTEQEVGRAIDAYDRFEDEQIGTLAAYLGDPIRPMQKLQAQLQAGALRKKPQAMTIGGMAGLAFGTQTALPQS